MTKNKLADHHQFGAFGASPVTITLTGAEWVAIMARMLKRELSDEGAQVYRCACESLSAQIGAASAAMKP